MEQRATLLPGAEYVALRESLTRPVKRMQGIIGKMTLSFKSVIWKRYINNYLGYILDSLGSDQYLWPGKCGKTTSKSVHTTTTPSMSS